MAQLRPALASLILLVFFSGCSWLPFRSPAPIKADLPAATLLARGEAELNKKDYTQAIRYFQKLKDDFPFSPQAGEVELRLAEAHYRNKQYAEATASFKDFLALHPTHGSVPFAVYHLGLIHFDQFNGIERDQKNTEIAKGYFESILRDYPNSPYASQAKEKLAQSLAYLAEHQLAVAAFYRREGKYPAARERLETVLRLYRETPAAAKALYQLGEIYSQEKNSSQAALAYQALIQHYPKSDLVKDAQIRLAQLENSRQDPLETLLARKNGANSSSTPSTQPPPAATPMPLVAKKGVVHEAPGDDKTVFRRAAERLNPVSWFSSGDDKKEEKEETKRAARKVTAKAPAKMDPELITKVDKTLDERGGARDRNLEIQPPAVTLPKVEDAPPKGVGDAPALLGSIDAQFKSRGKDGAELPPAPEGLVLPAPVTASGSAAKPAAVTTGLLGNIDRALKQKGIDPPKTGIVVKKDPGAGTPSQRAKREEKIELEPKPTSEKGPFFLETGEYQIQEPAGEEKQTTPAEGVIAAPPPQEIPRTIIQGPPQITREKPPEIKQAEKKKDGAEEEDAPKGMFDQIREDLESVGRVLNPFKW